jgi:hypothetical protein
MDFQAASPSTNGARPSAIVTGDGASPRAVRTKSPHWSTYDGMYRSMKNYGIVDPCDPSAVRNVVVVTPGLSLATTPADPNTSTRWS